MGRIKSHYHDEIIRQAKVRHNNERHHPQSPEWINPEHEGEPAMHLDRDGVPIYIPELDEQRKQEAQAEARKALAEEVAQVIKDQYLSDPPPDFVDDVLSYLADEHSEDEVIEILGSKIVVMTADEAAQRHTSAINWQQSRD